jgi:uncharacterized Zn-finger protein
MPSSEMASSVPADKRAGTLDDLSLSSSPLDALLKAVAMEENARAGQTHDTLASETAHDTDQDDGLLGMEMEMEIAPELEAAAAASLSSLMQGGKRDATKSSSHPTTASLSGVHGRTRMHSALDATQMPASLSILATTSFMDRSTSPNEQSNASPDLASSCSSVDRAMNAEHVLPIALQRQPDGYTLSSLSASRSAPCPVPTLSGRLTEEASLENGELDVGSPRDNTADRRRPFVCTFAGCGKRFAQLAHLRIHERAHTGDRPYVCSFEGCGRAFTQHGNLKTHERRHTGEKPFKCMFPGCGKAFSQQGNLRTHERIHLDVRPYQCPHPDCGRSFNQRGNLKVSWLRQMHLYTFIYG